MGFLADIGRSGRLRDVPALVNLTLRQREFKQQQEERKFELKKAKAKEADLDQIIDVSTRPFILNHPEEEREEVMRIFRENADVNEDGEISKREYLAYQEIMLKDEKMVQIQVKNRLRRARDNAVAAHKKLSDLQATEIPGSERLKKAEAVFNAKAKELQIEKGEIDKILAASSKFQKDRKEAETRKTEAAIAGLDKGQGFRGLRPAVREAPLGQPVTPPTLDTSDLLNKSGNEDLLQRAKLLNARGESIDPVLKEAGERARGGRDKAVSPLGKLQSDKQTLLGRGTSETAPIIQAIDRKIALAGTKKAKDVASGLGNKSIFDAEQSLRKEFVSQSESFRDVRDSFARVQASAKDPSPAGDLSLIFNFMKMLDPGSVVRESEFALAAATGSLGDRFVVVGKKLISGEKLSDSIRADFVNRSKQLFKRQNAQQKQRASTFRNIVRGFPDLDVDRVVIPLDDPLFNQSDGEVKSGTAESFLKKFSPGK